MTMTMWRRVICVALRIESLIVGAIGKERVRVDATLTSCDCPTTNWFNHRVTPGVHDDPANLVPSLVSGITTRPSSNHSRAQRSRSSRRRNIFAWTSPGIDSCPRDGRSHPYHVARR